MQPINENALNTPAFLGKLLKMVNDPSTDHLISWNSSGTSFIIQNQAQFWYELLPSYYKHNNMSSFVRQLNMYGFHKVPTVDNGSMDCDRDEIQFFHPCFQKDQPELMKMIKRKVTVPKMPHDNETTPSDLAKVLNEVKQLRGRQASIDGQLVEMKQENGLVWRELAFLRQKHLKQQKIVNKLIQFLVTLVQPTRMTVGVKRGYQLMLNESSSNKKRKSSSGSKSDTVQGPTIHELDSELDMNPDHYEEYEETPMVDSPTTSSSSQKNLTTKSPKPSTAFVEEDNSEAIINDEVWEKPEFTKIHSRAAAEDLIIADNEIVEENLMNALEKDSSKLSKENSQKIFLNPSAGDSMLINLMENTNDSSNIETTTSTSDDKTDDAIPLKNKESSSAKKSSTTNSDLTVATCDPNMREIMKSLPGTSDYYGGDLDTHVETTQSELDQLKNLLNGTLDANALLGELSKELSLLNYQDCNLFSDDTSANYGLSFSQDGVDPSVSGSELATYEPNLIDFTELFDDSLDGQEINKEILAANDIPASTVNTPQIKLEAPAFPSNIDDNI